MRIDELNKPQELDQFRKDYKDSKSKQVRRKLSQYMAQHGFKKLGSGAFAVVYAHENYPDSVFKVFQGDEAVERWITVSRMMAKDNPYFPRFKSGPIKVVGDIYMVRMERLSYKSEGEQARGAMFLRSYFTTMIDVLRNGRGGNPDTVRDKFAEKYPEFADDIYSDQFDEIFYEVIETVDWVNGKLDLHIGNFMWRGDQLVLTDPVAKVRGQ